MSKILLSANHIVKYFGERKILEFEKLQVYEGDRIGIVGINGAGKTTLLNILSGELTPDEGSVIRRVPVSYFRQSGTGGTGGPAGMPQTGAFGKAFLRTFERR